MKIFMIGQGKCNGPGLESLALDPDFRRSTENMAQAYFAMKSCIESTQIELKELKGSVGLVLGTSHGELGATVDFLEEIAKTGTARPLLFQASLHNATLGFLTKKFSITGASFTVSDTFFSGEESLELAMTLIETGILNYAFVVGVDVKVNKIEKALLEMYPQPFLLGSGAGCVLLSSEAGASGLTSKTHRQILELELFRKPQSSLFPRSETESFYDSNFVERMASLNSEMDSMISVKPNRSFSQLRLEIN